MTQSFPQQEHPLNLNLLTIAALGLAGNAGKVLAVRTDLGGFELIAAGGGGSISDGAYGVAWNADTTTGASRNALYDKIETLQTLDATLTALAGLDATAGLVEQTGADAFTKRAIGVGAASSIPTRSDGDARWQALDATLTALAAMAWSAGTQVVTLTAADTVTLKTVGQAAGNILDKAAGDALYQPVGSYQTLDATLTALAGLNATAGLVEQTGADAFTKRAIGVAASTDIPTRGDGDARWQATDAFLDDIAALTDPGADRLMFWDDSVGDIGWLTLGTNLSTSGTTLNASGGGGGAWTVVLKAADEQIQNDAALSPDAELVAVLGAGTWLIRGSVVFQCANATPDYQYTTAFSGTGTVTWSKRSHIGIGAAAGTDNENVLAGTGHPNGAPATTTTGIGFVEFELQIVVTVSGTFSFNWAQNTSNAAFTTVKAGSYLEYAQVA